MPFCNVGTQLPSPVADVPLNNDIKIFYRTYGGGPTKVLLIIGPSFLLFFFMNLFISCSCESFADFVEIEPTFRIGRDARSVGPTNQGLDWSNRPRRRRLERRRRQWWHPCMRVWQSRRRSQLRACRKIWILVSCFLQATLRFEIFCFASFGNWNFIG